jgi:hypothetical protein
MPVKHSCPPAWIFWFLSRCGCGVGWGGDGGGRGVGWGGVGGGELSGTLGIMGVYEVPSPVWLGVYLSSVHVRHASIVQQGWVYT